jgi:uroporphyrin-III C-methyltransferase
MTGKVYLIGAGPGDPELLTLKALRLLSQAEVVLHDDLVSTAILDLIPAWTQVRNVGKRCGRPRISQAEIQTLMITNAREGRLVIRLKSGDPLLFGRAGEEMEALAKAGIAFEVVPGITSAMGAAAAANLPLTDRRYASKLVFLTNHAAGNVEINADDIVSKDATHLVYMPGSNYEELAAKFLAGGLALDTPCLIVTNATRPEQKILRTTLCELGAQSRLPAPALLIVGEVVGRQLEPASAEKFSSAEQLALRTRDEYLTLLASIL